MYTYISESYLHILSNYISIFKKYFFQHKNLCYEIKENGVWSKSVATTTFTTKSYPCNIVYNDHQLHTLVLLHSGYLHFTTPHVQVSIPCRNNALSIDIVITSTYIWCIRRSKYYNWTIEYTYDRENQASGLRLYQKILLIHMNLDYELKSKEYSYHIW